MTLPADPMLAGAAFRLQALCVSPGGTMQLTNALQIVLGY
jgi:hypothetical protein